MIHDSEAECDVRRFHETYPPTEVEGKESAKRGWTSRETGRAAARIDVFGPPFRQRCTIDP